MLARPFHAQPPTHEGRVLCRGGPVRDGALQRRSSVRLHVPVGPAHRRAALPWVHSPHPLLCSWTPGGPHLPAVRNKAPRTRAYQELCGRTLRSALPWRSGPGSGAGGRGCEDRTVTKAKGRFTLPPATREFWLLVHAKTRQRLHFNHPFLK